MSIMPLERFITVNKNMIFVPCPWLWRDIHMWKHCKKRSFGSLLVLQASTIVIWPIKLKVTFSPSNLKEKREESDQNGTYYF